MAKNLHRIENCIATLCRRIGNFWLAVGRFDFFYLTVLTVFLLDIECASIEYAVFTLFFSSRKN